MNNRNGPRALPHDAVSVHVRFSQAEYEDVFRLASANRLSLAALIRGIVHHAMESARAGGTGELVLELGAVRLKMPA